MTVDVALVGGGLANLLIAWRLADLRPATSFRIFEAGPVLGGNHTWSFHGSDLDPASLLWVADLARATWEGYEVRFPTLSRTLSGRYHSIGSAELASRCRGRFPDRLETNARVTQLTPTGLVLADGSRVEARCVIDGRGWESPPGIEVGYQRFVGLEVRLARPHGLTRPLIMDATVAQEGGYRFMYAVPLGPELLLLEDTAYTDRPEIPIEDSRRAIERYATARGWNIVEVVRTESGALPIPLTGAIDSLMRSWVPGVPTVGVRAGLFHATTGYSLPHAVQAAELVATADPLDSASLAPVLARLTTTVWRRQRFFRLLNRMLFFAAAPNERYRVLERFYRLGEGLIERFYADRLTPWDRLRLVTGRPPVPLLRGLACLPERIPSSSR